MNIHSETILVETPCFNFFKIMSFLLQLKKKKVSFSLKRMVLEPSPTSQQNSLPQPPTLQHSPSIHHLSTKSRTEWWSALDPATPAPKKLCNSAAVAYQPFAATEGENRGFHAQSGPAVWTTEKPNRERKGKIKFNKETRWPHTLQEIKTIGNTEIISKSSRNRIRTAGCSAGSMQEYRKINLTLLKFLHLKTNRGETRVPQISGVRSWTKGV